MRIEELTFFRFIAASVVVIFHFGRESTGFTGALVSGSEMVTFFFVLSGLVMGIAYLKKEVAFKSYLWARASRIMPIYLCALGLMLVSNLMGHTEVDPIALVLNIFLLQAWVSPYPMTMNYPGWSLSVEAFFYISFPFILYLIKKHALSAMQLGLTALLMWFITHVSSTSVLSTDLYGGMPSFSHDTIFFFPLAHLCSFLFGIAGALWLLDSKHAEQEQKLALPILIGSFIVIVLILNNKQEIMDALDLKLAFGSSLLAPLFLCFILSIALCRSKLVQVFRLYPLVLLGEASYSLYILQLPMHVLYNRFLSDTLALNATLDFYAFFLFLTLVSLATFLFFEKPVNKFLRFSLPSLIKKKK